MLSRLFGRKKETVKKPNPSCPLGPLRLYDLTTDLPPSDVRGNYLDLACRSGVTATGEYAAYIMISAGGAQSSSRSVIRLSKRQCRTLSDRLRDIVSRGE